MLSGKREGHMLRYGHAAGEKLLQMDEELEKNKNQTRLSRR